jgi:hypothetical protein
VVVVEPPTEVLVSPLIVVVVSPGRVVVVSPPIVVVVSPPIVVVVAGAVVVVVPPPVVVVVVPPPVVVVVVVGPVQRDESVTVAERVSVMPSVHVAFTVIVTVPVEPPGSVELADVEPSLATLGA